MDKQSFSQAQKLSIVKMPPVARQINKKTHFDPRVYPDLITTTGCGDPQLSFSLFAIKGNIIKQYQNDEEGSIIKDPSFRAIASND